MRRIAVDQSVSPQHSHVELVTTDVWYLEVGSLGGKEVMRVEPHGDSCPHRKALAEVAVSPRRHKEEMA